MEFGNFKKIDFDEDESVPDWLRDNDVKSPATLQKKPIETSRVKSTEGFALFPVKYVSRAQTSNEDAQLKGNKKQKDKAAQAPTVSIQVHVPEFRMPKVSIPWCTLRPWLFGGLVAVALLVSGWELQTHLSRPKQFQKVPVIVAADLGYKPLVPAISTGTEAENAPKPTYDEQRKFYTFNDVYKGANITVNQQAVPEKLRGSETEIKKLATSMGAVDTFTTTLGVVHSATSKESGTQRMFLVNDKMLMFIQSTKTISDADWVNYLQGLQ
ncbi:MAG: hypothetical protein WBP03_03025 [Candidatus Saccharimonadales bacterium]